MVICATGYDLDVDYLADEIRDVVQADDTHLDLYARTFHPDFPGLAFLGQFLLIGPQFPTVELQARWIAGVWSGVLPAPSPSRMHDGIAEHRATRAAAPFDMYPALAGHLAAELGVEPDPACWPELAEGLIFGPLAPARYRLDGPGARPEAEAMLLAALSAFGPQPHASAEQLGALRMIAGALDDDGLAEVAERLSAELAGEPAIR
jgi:dimethylaniline monooxygenase (N-oxide forming)